MKNTKYNNSNALFLIVISLFILIFVIVSYVIVSGSIFDDDYDYNITKQTSNSDTNNASKNANEVFNIRDNVFTYDEAKSVCKAYGGKLATLSEVIDAYKKGANWCSYGWTNGQLALYPTQKEYWQKLQTDSKRKNECGKVGVNGGYFENKEYKFGVNCYGKKPNPKGSEVEILPFGKRMTQEDVLAERYKSQLMKYRISPFSNSDKVNGRWFSP